MRILLLLRRLRCHSVQSIYGGVYVRGAALILILKPLYLYKAGSTSRGIFRNFEQVMVNFLKYSIRVGASFFFHYFIP